MDVVGMALSESGGSVLLHVQPEPDRSGVDASALRGWLERQGYGDWLVDEQALQQAANRALEAAAPFSLAVAQRTDAAVAVHISADAMAATLDITPARGGAPATLDAVHQALAQAGVAAGVDEAALAAAVAAGGCQALVVAQGAPAEDGHDAEFEELIPAAPDRTPRLNAEGLIDYREHGDVVMVHTGALLMRRLPATPGASGYSVRGEVLPAKAGRDAPFAAQLVGAEVSAEDPNLLQASQTGHPVRVPAGIMVEPVLRLAEVNIASGNIRYDGTVHVDGEIGQEMRVEASGDIVVGGMVDGGILEAGGDITVTGGVIAHARLRAAGAITARFAETAWLYAGTSIVIGDMALECDMQSLNQIVVGSSAPQRGRLIGGRATAMMLIQTPLLGSASGGLTKLVLGSNPDLEARCRELRQQVEKELTAQDSLRKLIAHLGTAGDPQGLLARAEASLDHAIGVHAKTKGALEEVEQQLARTRNARVQVGLAVAGAVDLAFGRLHAQLRRDYRAGSFRVDAEGVLVFTDGSGYAVPAV